MSSPLEILLKQKAGLEPLHVYPEDVRQIRTQVDHFPYLQFYRGEYMDTSPHVFERNAGYAPRDAQRLDYYMTPAPVEKFEVPFQIPCSTILPRFVRKGYDERTNLTALFSR